MQLAAAQAEAEERTQAAAGAQAATPKDPAAESSELSRQSQDTPGQQATAPEQAGQTPAGPQPTASQPGAAPVRKSVKESGSRSTLRFAESPTVAAMSDEDSSVSGDGLIVHSPTTCCSAHAAAGWTRIRSCRRCLTHGWLMVDP